MKLYKTTIVIWTDFDPDGAEAEALVLDAVHGGIGFSELSEAELANDPDYDGWFNEE